jgi:drug/metabolite transporter (DMT)-like permease
MTSSSTVHSPATHRERWLADASLLAIAAVWGATFFMIKDVTRTYPVMAFLAIRFSLASLALLPALLFVRRWPTRTEIKWGLIAGLLFYGGYIFQTFSLKLIDSGRTGFITGLYVILVPILALLILRHPLKVRPMIGAGLAVVGLALLSNAPGGGVLGDFLAFLCALCFAGQIIAVEKFPRKADWRVMAILQSATVAILSTLSLPLQSALTVCDGSAGLCQALQPFADKLPNSVPLNVLGVAAFTGLVATAIGLVIQVWAQRKLPPADAALIFSMESPFSALFGWLFLHEVLTFTALVGCGLILIGMLTTALGGLDEGFTPEPGTQTMAAIKASEIKALLEQEQAKERQ